MGRHIPPGQEARALRELIADARQAAAELRAEIRAAAQLAPSLVAEFERVHTEEISALSNFFVSEANRHAADLNADIERARKMIMEQIMAGEAVFDAHTQTVAIRWPGPKFDDRQPLPYPDAAPKETPQ